MNTVEIMDMIKKHEGCRLEIYFDTEGIPTTGYGHALYPGSQIPKAVAEMFFIQDFDQADRDYYRYIWRYKIEDLNSVRRAVITDMMFNLGYKGVCGFKKMTAALQDRDYVTAAAEMLDSKWAIQVRHRAFDLANKMERG